jgi:VanZ family protein
MGAILTATSIPERFLPTPDIPHADKVVHVVMYGILGFLMCRAMDDPARTTRARAWFGAFLFCIAMGAVDEWHQEYIQGRVADIRDWSADAVGGAVGSAIWISRSRQRATRHV